MKAILVTQELKEKNPIFFVNDNVEQIVIKRIPDLFNGAENINAGGYKNRQDLQDVDGWKDVVLPTFDPDTERLGGLILGDNAYTYKVNALTEQQIKDRLTAQSQNLKQELIREKTEQQITQDAQNATDEDALEQKDLYPFWSGEAVSYELGFKVLDFTAENELALYKVIQAHTSQSNWNPISVPALFTRIQLDEVLDWVQPTGAQDAYNEGDQVIFPSGSGSIWESTVDANVFAPEVVAGQWVKL